LAGVNLVERLILGDPLARESNVRKHIPEALQDPNGRRPRGLEINDHIAETYSAFIDFHVKGVLVGTPIRKRPVSPTAVPQSV
jgi:hypothetical protein